MTLAAGPAVSAPNGKLEFDAGALNVPAPGFLFRAAGSLTLPVSDSFGVQGDLVITSGPGGLGFGGAAHAFTRDPDSYLLGVAAGAYGIAGSLLFAAGPEAELYLDRASFEVWGGFAGLTYSGSTPAKAGLFVLADAGYYVHDDFRVTLGAGSVIGVATLHLGAEYLFHNDQLPFSIAADARAGQDGSLSAMLGVKFFLGGTDKSLIERHRHDDPPGRGTDIAAATGAALHAGAAGGNGGGGGGGAGDGANNGSSSGNGTDTESTGNDPEAGSNCLAFVDPDCV